MRSRTRGLLIAAIAMLMVATVIAPAAAKDDDRSVRFATFNASLNREFEGELGAELANPGSAQPDVIAEIIQRTRPDVLLINEFDFDPQALVDFQKNYLEVGADPIFYEFTFIATSNTGIHSGLDLDDNSIIDSVPDQPFPDFFNYAGDSLGFGAFPGQFGMAVLSMYRIDYDNVRTFQNFKWKDMPGALLPEDPPGTPWYTPAELDILPLSSKSHWDVPIQVGEKTVHFLVSHPTPPVFDGPEDRNGTRNHDEIRFWADYVSPGKSGYIYDDDDASGGLKPGSMFVIAGDQNSDPFDGDSIPGSAQQLTEHPLVNTKVTPSSPGGTEQAALQGNANTLHVGDPAFDSADFFDGFPPPPFGGAPGNLRADYVLPRKNLRITDAGVFWPLAADPLFPLVGVFPFPGSDHRLVWVDVSHGGFPKG